MTAKPTTLTIAAIAGLNNRRPDFKLATKDASFVRAAVNADITAEGTAKRREGYELVLAGVDCHSFWSDGEDAFFVDGQNLNELTGLPTTAIATTLRSDLVPGRPVSYAKAPDGIYYSNGLVLGRIVAGALKEPAPPRLAVTPGVVAMAGGALPAGRYSVCFTLVDADGKEGGSTAPEQVEVPAGGLIRCSSLPAAFPAGVAALSIYMSDLNAALPLRAAVLTVPALTHDLLGMASGGRCQTLLLSPMPAGDIVRYHRGRLLTAAGSTLFISEPFMLGLFNPSRGYLRFAADISIVEPCEGGLWVCADQTYWIAGDITATSLVSVLPYGAVPGTSVALTDKKQVSWMSPRGLVIADAVGAAVNVQKDNVAINPAAAGATLHRERDGMQQIVSSLFGTETTRVAATSWFEAEIVRKGTQL